MMSKGVLQWSVFVAKVENGAAMNPLRQAASLVSLSPATVADDSRFSLSPNLHVSSSFPSAEASGAKCQQS